MLIVLLGFFIYLEIEGKALSERARMNVGYAMIALILTDVIINLGCLLVMTVISISAFCCKRKRRIASSDILEEEAEREHKGKKNHRVTELNESDIDICNETNHTHHVGTDFEEMSTKRRTTIFPRITMLQRTRVVN